MKVLVVLTHSGFFRHLESVGAHLLDQGHEVKVVSGRGRKVDADELYQRQLLSSVRDYDLGSYDFTLLRRRGVGTRPTRRLAGVMSHAIYFRPQHNSPQLAPRMARLSLPPARAVFATRVGRRLVASNSFLAAYRRLQAHLPADRCLVRVVEGERPDVVVACPFIYRTTNDVEYIRAAQKLRIPTVAVVASWDNLSTKGTFHLLPDSVVVWNEALAKEAQLIHAIPRDRLAVTGAAKFDPYFELEPSMSRDEFCARVGVDPGRPYLLYIGSSEQVAGDETGFVRELAAALARDPRTAAVQVVVRPHPLNGQVWLDFEDERVTVFPRGGQRPDIAGPRDDYFHTLRYAAAVAGVNTTAFLEAAIADRPCLSIVSDRHRAGQVERGHFQHLLKGGFIETVPDFEGAVAVVADLLEGRDAREARRRRFVGSFVRPRGIDRPAGAAVAEAILETASTGVRESEPILPSRIAPPPSRPARRKQDPPPPTGEQERAALLVLHDGHPIPVRQPLALISQLGGEGGDLLNRLFDGHPQCHVHPHRLDVGHPEPDTWPALDMGAGPDAWWEALRERRAARAFANGSASSGAQDDEGAAGDGAPFLLVPALQRRMFDHCVAQWQPASARDVLDCYMTSYFNAWLDYQSLYGGERLWVTGFGARLGLGAENQRAFFEDYPDGHLILVVSSPDPSLEDWPAGAESLLEAKRTYGDRLTIVPAVALADDTQAVMRSVAAGLGLEFSSILCRPTLNGLPAGAVPTARRPPAVDSRAGELYDRLVSVAG
jgi:hypothetical protein